MVDQNKSGYGGLAPPGGKSVLVSKRMSSFHHKGVLPPFAEHRQPPMPSNAGALIADQSGLQPNQLHASSLQKKPSFRARRVESVDHRAASAALGSEPSLQDLLGDPSFNMEKHAANLLYKSNPDDIAGFIRALGVQKEMLQKRKKEQAEQKYRVFLNVGKDFTSLKNEIEVLRNSLSEFTLATTAMLDDANAYLKAANDGSLLDSSSSLLAPIASNGSTGANGGDLFRKHSHRHSMVVVEGMWEKELGQLFAKVEGAQKFLPQVPGRRIVLEVPGWIACSPATLKPTREHITIFLLNDHLLVAGRKKTNNRQNAQLAVPRGMGSNGPGNSMLETVYCWPLQDIRATPYDRTNTAYAGDPHRLLVVSTVSTNYVFEARSVEIVKQMLSEVAKQQMALARAAPGQNSRVAAEASVRKNENMTYLAAQNPNLRNHRQVLQEMAAPIRTHSRSSSLDIAGRSKSLRDADKIVNELDVSLAHRDFEEAVRVMEKHGLGKTIADGNISQDVLRVQVVERIGLLKDKLVGEIEGLNLSRPEIETYLHYLRRLGYDDVGKKAFLESRHNLIQQRYNQLPFTGVIPTFLYQVTIIYFKLIQSTVDIYKNCYEKPQYASAIVEWADKEVEDFTNIFARQMYNVKKSSSLYVECLKVAQQQASALSEAGLDMSPGLARLQESL